jgi:RNA polymerase sigma-70 factor, ECF subfamily
VARDVLEFVTPVASANPVHNVLDGARLAPATDELVARYWSRTHRFAAMVTRNDQDAADVAQEAMERVIRNADRYSAERGSFEGWLWRIVVNTARDAGRASTRRAALFDRLVGARRTEAAADTESLALQRISDQELLRAVRELKPRPRTVIALRFGAQLSYAEIAEQIGLTEAAAVMATRRALDALRKSLGEKR